MYLLFKKCHMLYFTKINKFVRQLQKIYDTEIHKSQNIMRRSYDIMGYGEEKLKK